MKKNTQKTILKNRLDAIRVLLKGQVDISQFEREVALLALDVLVALDVKAVSFKEADRYFTDIAYKMEEEMEQKTSEDLSALVAEVMLLDEVGKKYGPNLAEFRELATRILARDKKLVNYSVLSRTFA